MSLHHRDRVGVAERDAYICRICGGHAAFEDGEVDHIVPRSAGGSDDWSNLRWAHRKCNNDRREGLWKKLGKRDRWYAHWPQVLVAQAVQLGVKLSRSDRRTKWCEKCGDWHPARCRVSLRPTKTAVLNERARLEREMFQRPEDRERLNEICVLAEQQVLDDVYSIVGAQRERIGREWVSSRGEFDDKDNDDKLWPTRTEEQLALERGTTPVLDRLTPNQRVVVRMRYWSELQLPEIAKMLGKTKQSVHQQLGRIHAAISRILTEEFGA